MCPKNCDFLLPNSINTCFMQILNMPLSHWLLWTPGHWAKIIWGRNSTYARGGKNEIAPWQGSVCVCVRTRLVKSSFKLLEEIMKALPVGQSHTPCPYCRTALVAWSCMSEEHCWCALQLPLHLCAQGFHRKESRVSQDYGYDKQ